MTPSGFMTDDAWLKVTRDVAAGIRRRPVIVDHPDWWVVMTFDGFKCHVNNPVALRVWWEHRIMLIKEEGDNSHVAQPFDRHPAKSDKSSMRRALTLLRSSAARAVLMGVVDQFKLVHVGLAAVRQLTRESWVASFVACNLHPHHRKPFAEWLKSIEHFLEGGKTFKCEEPIDLYRLLPAFWHGTSPAEKRAVVAVVDRFEIAWSVDCLVALRDECHIAIADMQKLRLCYDLAKEQPATLNLGVPEADSDAADAAEDPELAAAKVAQKPVTHGLDTYQLKPPALTGEALFKHMCRFRQRQSGSGEVEVRGAGDIEMTTTQQTIIAPSAKDLTIGEIMKSAGGAGATMKLAQRKLDQAGCINAHCTRANAPDRVGKLQDALRLAASIADVNRQAASEKEQARAAANVEMLEKAPAALTKLKAAGGDLTKLTVAEIRAVAWCYLGTVLPKSGNKSTVFVAPVAALITANPAALDGAARLAAPAVDGDDEEEYLTSDEEQ